MSVPTFTKTGTKAATAATLEKQVFSVFPTNQILLHDAYVAHLANSRQQLATTKNRGDVRGGGRKPWKQKGTGRARVGSNRSPIWRGGGVVFGPTGVQNYSKGLTTQAKRLALKQALSLAAQDNKIRVIETFDVKEGTVGKTLTLLKKIDARGRALIVVSLKDSLVERATRNLQNVKSLDVRYLNVPDILNADTIIVSQKALAILSEWLGVAKTKPSLGRSKL